MHEAPQEKTFVVLLKGVASKVAQVRYEKDESDLKLYFTLRQPPPTLSIETENDSGHQNLTLSERIEGRLLHLLKSHADPQVRLWGALLSRLEYIPASGLFVAVLAKQELESTQLKMRMLPAAMLSLTKAFGEQFSFFVLVDSDEGCRGILWSSSPLLRTKLKNITGSQQKGHWVLLRPTPLSSYQLKHAFLS